MKKKTKKQKRKELVRKLFYNILSAVRLQNEPIKLVIKNHSFYTNGQIKILFNHNKELVRAIVLLNLDAIGVLSSAGLGNHYYKNRSENTAFLKHNKHKMLRFIILHELGHFYNRVYNLRENTEKNADTFAIENLNRVK